MDIDRLAHLQHSQGQDDFRLSVRHGHAGPQRKTPPLIETVNDPYPVDWTVRGFPMPSQSFGPNSRGPPPSEWSASRQPYPPPEYPGPPRQGSPTGPSNYPFNPPKSWPYIKPGYNESYGYPVPPEQWRGPGPYPCGPNPRPQGQDQRLVEAIDHLIDEKLQQQARSSHMKQLRNSIVQLGREYKSLVRPQSPTRSSLPMTSTMVGREITRSRPTQEIWQYEPYTESWTEPRRPPEGGRHFWEKPAWNSYSPPLNRAPRPPQAWELDEWAVKTPRPWTSQVDHHGPPPPSGSYSPQPRHRLTERGQAYRDSLFYPVRTPLR